MRRLFYYNHQEAKHPPNLVYLQNKYVLTLYFLFELLMNENHRSILQVFSILFRTTKHLEYIIEQMKRDSKFRQTGINELSKIFQR